MNIGNEERHKSRYTGIIPTIIWWTGRLQKKILSYFSTEKGFSLLIALVSTIIITLILSSRYITSDNILKANISTKDIYATKMFQLEDLEETQRSRYEAKQSIFPVYKKQSHIDKIIIERLTDLLEKITTIRLDKNLTYAQKVSSIENLLKNRNTQVVNMDSLINSSQWNAIYAASIETLETLFKQEIRSEDLRTRKDFLIRQAAAPYIASLSKADADLVVFLAGLELKPTLIIDEKSTEEAREIAASQVFPVIKVYNKGDLIIKKGEKITELQRIALQKQGSLINKNRFLSAMGISILSISLLSIVWGYLYRFEHSNFFKPAYAGLMAVMMIGSVGGLSLLTDFHPGIILEIFPIAIMSLMVCIFTHPRIAILTTMMILLLCGLALKISLDSLAIPVISSMVGIFLLSRNPVPHDRNDLILAGLGVGISRGIVILAISFIYEPAMEMEEINLFFRIWAGILSGVFSGVLTLGFLPIIESWFKLITPYTLLELGNHDRPLLRRMQMEAPGTFHHSLMVATLSESASKAIEANPILARVGALYHDVGKLKRPLFFVENQAYFGIENPHDKLTPRLSKMVITAHPRDGMELAKQWGLPKIIKRFMSEHHGTLIASYFYNKAVLEEGEENVNKIQFRYPGPKPQSKESAIVMLADACESAVRALKNPTITQIEERIDKVIKQRIDDAQFSECPLTFQDIQIIRDTFIQILKGIQHHRIEYQQNILEELGKKPVGEHLKQVGHKLKSVSMLSASESPASTHHPSPPAENGNNSAHDINLLNELNSLAELAKEEKKEKSIGPEST